MTLRVVVTRADGASHGASLDILLGCWLERVARLIARRDTPRESDGPPRKEPPPPAR